MSGLAQCPDRCIFMAATREMSDVFSIRRSRDVEILLKYLEDRHYPAVFIFITSILTCDLSKIHKNNVHLNLAMHGSSGQLVSASPVRSSQLRRERTAASSNPRLNRLRQQHPPCLPAHHLYPSLACHPPPSLTSPSSPGYPNIPHIPHNDRRTPLPRPARNPDRRIPEIDHSFPEGSRPEGSERLCFRQRCQGDGRP